MKNSVELELAIRAAKAGGEVICRYFAKDSLTDVEQKIQDQQNQGLVTNADLESEQVIVDTIRQAFPGHSILAEESYRESLEAEHLWIIDPLDGTNNFAHGIPHFAVSIAYYRQGRPDCGVIYQPVTNELFTTESGHGACHNGRSVLVNRHQKLDETMVAVGFYYDRGQMMQDTLATMERLFRSNIHGIRRMGTASLDLVQVGLGRFGAYFEYALSPWDFAAGRLFVEEAGGRVTDCLGAELKLQNSSLLASNGFLHQVMLEKVKWDSSNPVT